MPGTLHEVIVKLVQDQPAIAADLLLLADTRRRQAGCVSAETRSCSVGSPGPVERRADCVVKLSLDDGSERIVVVEVQNEWKKEKYYRLPGYMTRVFEDYRLPVEMLVVCGSDALARRFRGGIELGPGNRITVRPLGPSDLPTPTELTDEVEPVVVLLAAALGAQTPPDDPELFVSTVDRALGRVETQRAVDYTMYLLELFAKEIGTLLETLMQTKSRPYHSAYSDRLREEGLERGLEEGLEKGLEKGLEEMRHVLFDLLEKKSQGADAEQRQAIEGCRDLHRLRLWITEVAIDGRFEATAQGSDEPKGE